VSCEGPCATARSIGNIATKTARNADQTAEWPNFTDEAGRARMITPQPCRHTTPQETERKGGREGLPLNLYLWCWDRGRKTLQESDVYFNWIVWCNSGRNTAPKTGFQRPIRDFDFRKATDAGYPSPSQSTGISDRAKKWKLIIGAQQLRGKILSRNGLAPSNRLLLAPLSPWP
jgi:hypothetical protein